jgi:CheY-like chemotaxis protein
MLRVCHSPRRAPQFRFLDRRLAAKGCVEQMPDRSGWDVLRDLRRRQLQIPIIVLSAVRVSQNRLDEFQPMAYLPKPFPIEALLRLVVGQVATPAVRQPRW